MHLIKREFAFQIKLSKCKGQTNLIVALDAFKFEITNISSKLT